jgi:hypothetical protein
MKTLAYIPLHYGKEYLKYAIQSVEASVDTVLILFSPHPTYGHHTSLSNPDKTEELRSIVNQFTKCKWIEIPSGLNGEGRHRDLAIQYGVDNKFDIVLAVDADEVWKPETVEPAIKSAYDQGQRRYATNHQGWFHFWRSFNEVCRDGFEPIRLTNLKRSNNDQGRVTESIIYHFGYANCVNLQEYKMSIHGHKSEIADNWFAKKWLNYKRGETKQLHPASRDIWNETESFDKNTLPDFMKDHPYFNFDRIV